MIQKTPRSINDMLITVTNTATLIYSLVDTASTVAGSQTYYSNALGEGVVNLLSLRPQDGDIRVAIGVTPTSTKGFQIKEGTRYLIPGDIVNLKLIRVGGADVAVDVGFFVAGSDEAINGMSDTVTLDVADIEIGAVELKDGTTDTRGIINAANTARAATDQVVLVQALNAAGGVLGTVPMPITFSTTVVQTKATGAAAINATTAIGAEFRLVMVTCHLSSAPTTSQNFIIGLDAQAGAAYDTVLFTINPATSSTTDIVFIPDNNADFFAGDEILVTFTNTDARTYGLTIYYELI